MCVRTYVCMCVVTEVYWLRFSFLFCHYLFYILFKTIYNPSLFTLTFFFCISSYSPSSRGPTPFYLRSILTTVEWFNSLFQFKILKFYYFKPLLRTFWCDVKIYHVTGYRSLLIFLGINDSVYKTKNLHNIVGFTRFSPS